MALKVRLPLNKDTRNVGLTHVNVINNGATLTTGGIYGNCFLFNLKRSFLTFETPVSLPPIGHSICCWLTLSDVTSKQFLLGFENGGISYNGKTFSYVYDGIGIKWDYEPKIKWDYEPKVDTFVHIAFVCNSKSVKLYVDGTLLKEEEVKITGKDKCVFVGKINDEYYYHGKMNDLRIYDHALTDADILKIYNCKSSFETPYSRETEKPTQPLWLKLLHHNAPASQLFTTANYKKNTSDNLYSRCGWMFGNMIFKLDNNTYEFLAKEKIESGSAEQTYRWTQISSPTASTITGFNTITNTSNSSYLVGLKHTGNYSAFHNGGSWWCACGSYSAYQGGTPGFQGVVKTGYIDLWVRAEIKHLPNDYDELEYIQSTGTQYIDTNVKISSSNVKYNIKFQMTTASSSFCPFGTEYNNGSSNVRWGGLFYGYKRANLYIGTQAHEGKWTFRKNTDYDLSLDINDGSFTATLNGHSMSGKYNGEIINDLDITVGLFCLNRINNNNVVTRGAYASSTKMKLYHFEIIENGIVKFNGIPAKRKSENAIGLYDLASHKFFTNVGSGSFTGA